MDYQLPLGILRQAIMKQDSFMTDMNELIESETLDPKLKITLQGLKNMSESILYTLINIGEADDIYGTTFMDEPIEMDTIDEYPTSDIL